MTVQWLWFSKLYVFLLAASWKITVASFLILEGKAIKALLYSISTPRILFLYSIFIPLIPVSVEQKCLYVVHVCARVMLYQVCGQIILPLKYKLCSKSNASYFIMLALDFRGRCWWYGSRDWSLPPTFHYINRWQQKGSLTNGVWHRRTYEAKVSLWVYPWGKNCTHWHSLAECLWRPNSETERGEVVCFSCGNSGSPSLVLIFTRAAHRLLFLVGENE